MVERVSGYIESKYAAAIEYGNESIAALDEFGATNETMLSLEKKGLYIMDGLAAKV